MCFDIPAQGIVILRWQWYILGEIAQAPNDSFELGWDPWLIELFLMSRYPSPNDSRPS